MSRPVIEIASMLLAPSAAHAANSGQVTVLRSWKQGNCLDSNFAGNVYTNPCDATNSLETGLLTCAAANRT